MTGNAATIINLMWCNAGTPISALDIEKNLSIRSAGSYLTRLRKTGHVVRIEKVKRGNRFVWGYQISPRAHEEIVRLLAEDSEMTTLQD